MDPLKYIFKKLYLLSRIARWQMLLTKNDIVCMMKKAIREGVIVDHLAKYVVEDYELLNFDFHDKDVLIVKEEENSEWWTMYFDDVINVSSNEVGVAIILPSKKQFTLSIMLKFEYTNNLSRGGATTD